MSNLSIFERNVIHAFGGVTDEEIVLDEAEAMFLRGVPRDRQAAERAALDWCAAGPAFAVMGAGACRVLTDQKPGRWREEAPAELWAFMRERTYRRHLSGN